jgi:DNA (cytosine-5)-methyltransferase 1
LSKASLAENDASGRSGRRRSPCDAAWFGHGRQSGATLQLPRGVTPRDAPGAALANDDRPLAALAALQGLATVTELGIPPFTREAARQAIGNGVPLHMGRALAAAVVVATVTPTVDASHPICACGCGRPVTPPRKSYDNACRKRIERTRRRAATSAVPHRSPGQKL